MTQTLSCCVIVMAQMRFDAGFLPCGSFLNRGTPTAESLRKDPQEGTSYLGKPSYLHDLAQRQVCTQVHTERKFGL